MVLQQSLKKKESCKVIIGKKNKASIFADIGVGAAFFIVAKVTGDLRIAAFTGCS
jgi:hypothetical protein